MGEVVVKTHNTSTYMVRSGSLQRGFVPRTAKVCSKCFVSISSFMR